MRIKRTNQLPFPLKHYTRVGQSTEDCVANCYSKTVGKLGDSVESRRKYNACAGLCYSGEHASVVFRLPG